MSVASEAYGSMYLWYGLLSVAIEGFQVRSIDLRGRFADDIERLAPTLRPCRNAIVHVPKRTHNPRLFKPMEMPNPGIAGNRSYTRSHFLHYAGVVSPGAYR